VGTGRAWMNPGSRLRCPRFRFIRDANPYSGRMNPDVVPSRSDTHLLDDVGGLEEHVLGDGEAEGSGRLEVNDEVEPHRLFDG
jgi:hypothetical protein